MFGLTGEALANLVRDAAKAAGLAVCPRNNVLSEIRLHQSQLLRLLFHLSLLFTNEIRQ